MHILSYMHGNPILATGTTSTVIQQGSLVCFLVEIDLKHRDFFRLSCVEECLFRWKKMGGCLGKKIPLL